MRRAVFALGASLGLVAALASTARAADSTVPERAASSVVIVHSSDRVGAGVVVEMGTVVTAAHVVGSDSRVAVEWEGQRYRASVTAVNRRTDLARLAVAALPASPLILAEAAPAPGATAYAIGAPAQGLSVTRGVVSAAVRRHGVEYLQTDAAINQGNSGGPLVDEEGRIVGIVVAKQQSREGIGYAVAATEVRQLLSAEVTTRADGNSPEPSQGDESHLGLPLVLGLGVVAVAILVVLSRRRPSMTPLARPPDPVVVLGRVLPPETEKENAPH